MAISNPVKGARAARPSPDVRQYQTHLQLLAHTSARLKASLDAIIVPASRSAGNLDHAVTLARALRCQLVVLCSLEAQADKVNELLALRNFTGAIVVDIPRDYAHPKLDFATSGPGSFDYPPDLINPVGDLSTKRNLGLLLARMLGWERIFFMDDDIRDLEAASLREVASMLGPYLAVGMRAIDFPDNSVVCHGHRKTGGYQDVFISGSVLAVHCAEPVAFFPAIYNEDWFFFYHAAAARRLGQYSRDATQLCYDPFADPHRAAGQEFGDVMAEGMYGLLHHRIGVEHATRDYWQMFLSSRMSFLEAVLGRSERVEPYLRQRIVRSIETALERAQQITPAMCDHYMTLWRGDLETWAQRFKDLPRVPSVKAALLELDLEPSGQSPYVLSGIIGGIAGGRPEGVSAAAAMIPSGIAPGGVQRIEALGALPGISVMANGGSDLISAQDLPPAGAEGGGYIRGVFKRAGEIALRALIAAEPTDPNASRSRGSSRVVAGRHRKPQEPRPVVLSGTTEPVYAGQEPVSC